MERYFSLPRLYLSGCIGLALAVFLLYPGNPVWDLSDTRVANTILIYLSLLPLMLAVYWDRDRFLLAFATRPRRVQLGLAVGVPLGLVALLRVLAWLSPLYAWSLSREWGLLEPLSLGLYWLALWATVSWARWRREQGHEFKPYQALAVLFALAVLEECDYLGIFGGVIGRIHGIYVGSLHDLVALWYRTGPNLWWAGAAGLVGVAVGVWSWKFGYCSAAFLQREVWTATSVPVICGMVLLVISQLGDIDKTLFGRLVILWCRVCEETLEFLFAVLLQVSLWLKIARDYRNGLLSITAQDWSCQIRPAAP
ncbi:MAG: hypothetical protein OEU26_05610 [Candidatus Tectomicrobia bacterium]|nr:hypothetical protein [Candidatus Tectomicrobia bacterium]